ncbi:hypothetical protein CR513_13222, partial [Mucuna pruriens]
MYRAHSSGLTPLFLAISGGTLQHCHDDRCGRLRIFLDTAMFLRGCEEWKLGGKRWENQAKNGETFPQSLVKALNKERDEKPKMASLHESEGSFKEGNYSEISGSSQSTRRERHERQERVERYRREERREIRGTRGEEQRREKLDMSKCKILPFLGNSKPKVYVDWELKVEQILSCFDVEGCMVVWFVTLEFVDTSVGGYKEGYKDPYECLVALKRLMRERFVPPSYTRNLHNKNQRQHEGSKKFISYKEMEMDLMKDQIWESGEATMARFLHNLNKKVQDVVELQQYATLRELVHRTIKVEMQIKRRSTSRRPYLGSSGGDSERKREKEKVKRDKSLKKESDSSHDQKEITTTLTPNAPRTSNIKCFKYLGRGHIASQ